MISKTVRYDTRMGKDRTYVDRLLIETWWLFGFILLYRRETITATNR